MSVAKVPSARPVRADVKEWRFIFFTLFFTDRYQAELLEDNVDTACTRPNSGFHVRYGNLRIGIDVGPPGATGGLRIRTVIDRLTSA